eukprot:CAMPEP_0118711202 /NCGR_PEP_ID=MMETSP0800-20121206/23922_1 /TAXON_ID=210618 ORGANISM="Striatella unipunctata, Strain CCMP2910" /NCGR_SAMPLE_ID=MMETSP0800 /ASSEMBLY_ACC=CAM_ASM_000638 /LENGTH=420 /DNA_ID=CAMNT_0006615701 /DNA_START=62 /DNA_END=1325 /DNA_ORIENTATION=-
MTRAETAGIAMAVLRDAAGPTIGCPYGAGIGIMDGMRVSADTGPTWYPAFPLPWWDEGTLPSLRSMIRNTITRACIGHRWWHNDPDCLLLGESTSLTEEEVVSAASIVAMTSGMTLVSDDLNQLQAGRLRVLTKIYPSTGATAVPLNLLSTNESGMPTLLRLWCTDRFAVQENDETSVNAETTACALRAAFAPEKPLPNPVERMRNCVHVTKGLGSWSVVSLSNWKDTLSVSNIPMAALLPPPDSCFLHAPPPPPEPSNNATYNVDADAGYHVFAFWSSKYIWIPRKSMDEQQTLSKQLHPHETEIFHVKEVDTNTPQYIGSDFHFSCGFEVKKFVTTNSSVEIYLKNDWKRVGYVYVYIPRIHGEIVTHINGEAGTCEVIAQTPLYENDMVLYSGRVVRVLSMIHGISSDNDGFIRMSF